MKDANWIANLLAGYRQITVANTPITQRNTLNLISGVAVDNPSTGATDLSLTNTHTSPHFFADLSTLISAGTRDIIFLDGYSTANDGGGGLFVWDANSTATPDNGTVVSVTGVLTGRWKRLISGLLPVEAFGVFGDSISVGDGVISIGSNTIQCNASKPFTAAMIGKTIYVGGIGTANAPVVRTITAVPDASHATFSGAAAATAVPSSAYPSGAPVQVVVTDNTTAIQTMIAANLPMAWKNGVYAFQSSQVRISKNRTHWEGAGGLSTIEDGDLGYSLLQGTKLLGIGAGTVLAGPAVVSGNAVASNVGDCTFRNFILELTSDADYNVTGGLNKCLDFSGLNLSHFEKIKGRLAQHCLSYGRYATTTIAGGIGQGDYENTWIGCSWYGDFSFDSGQKGVFLALNPTSSVDAGGTNGDRVVTETVFGCNVGWHLEHAFGASYTGLVSEDCHDIVVQCGSPAQGLCINCQFQFAYIEGIAYIAKFGGPNATGTRGNLVVAGGSGSQNTNAGLAAGATIDPGSNRGLNEVRLLGSTHGNSHRAPLSGSVGSYQGVLSGRFAGQGLPMPAPSGWADAAAQTYVLQLWQALTAGSTLAPWSPMSLGTPLAWWRSDYLAQAASGQRAPHTTMIQWADFLNTQLLAFTGGFTYEDGSSHQNLSGAGEVFQSAPSALSPYLYTDGTGYAVCTLATGLASGTVILIASIANASAMDQTLFEITDGTDNGGIRIYVDGAGNLVGRRASHAGGVVSTASLSTSVLSAGNDPWKMIAFSFTNAAGNLYVGALNKAIDGATVTLPTMTALYVGADSVAHSHKLTVGSAVAEIILYADVRNDAQIQNFLQQYAIDTYGVTG